MKCDFDFCVFNKSFKCMHGETQINSYGMCEECVIVSIPPDELERLKESQLKRLDKTWEK